MQLKVVGEGSWEISNVSEIEYLFLKRVPAAANVEGCDAARKRILPGSALDSDAAGNGGDSEDDWRELVVPELEKSFGDAVSVFESDVDKAQSGPGEEGEIFYRISVESGHSEQWYSALNQARLVLAQRYQLPLTEEGLLESESIDERWLASAQSDLYAFIQGFLLETVLKMP